MTKIIAISIPKGLYQKIDLQRGDISRSKFISRVLENGVDRQEVQR